MGDNEKRQTEISENYPGGGQSGRTTAWLLAAVLVLLALLAWGELYTYQQVKQFKELGQRMEAQSAAAQEALKKEAAERMAALDRAYQKATRDMQEDVKVASARVMLTRKELKRTKEMTEKLQAEHQRATDELSRELAAKADQQQVGTLSHDVSTTRQDLDSTRKTLQETIEKLGMTRSEFGTLIARNHDEIEQLRRLGERDYFEFTLDRPGNTQHVASVGLQLRKTNVKKLRYTLDLYTDDYRVEKKDRTINEPVFFYVRGHKKALELVVNKVENNRVVGYLSVPKGTMVAEGTTR